MSSPEPDRTQKGRPVRAILLSGPTASGKTALALTLAERLSGTIINADSMQVYRELPILSAQPSPDDQARVPHRLFGFVSAAEPFSVADWLEAAARAIAAAERAGRLPILVGGTGLYFQALTEGLAAVPAIPAALRRDVRARLAALGAESLHRELALRDPEMAQRLRPTDAQRVARALEVIEATGRSLGAYQAAAMQPPVLARDAAFGIVLAPPRDALYARIDARFAAMVEIGALGEVEALAAMNVPETTPAGRALGIGPLLRHLHGEITLAEAVRRGQTLTRRYAKRQLTWLRRKMISWTWVEEQLSETEIREIFPLVT